jgi:hypothetical protein
MGSFDDLNIKDYKQANQDNGIAREERALAASAHQNDPSPSQETT